jgi:CDP-glycerol glycerophosphotransferase (TagB/SpsB family)
VAADVTPQRYAANRARRLVLRRLAARAGEALRSVVLAPLYAVAGFVPRDPRRVAFGGNGDRFTDNAKHLFLALAEDDRFTCTWITGDRAVVAAVRATGGRAELRWSWRGMVAALRAGWFVYGAYPSDVNFWLSRGARLLDLWHGIPLKAIEFDIDTGPLVRVYRSRPWSPLRLAFIDRFRRPDLLVSTSPFLTERCFTSAFRLPPERCIEVGYPRTDHLFAPEPKASIAARLGIADAGRIIGYFPTWRDDGRDFLADAGFSFDDLDVALAAAGHLLVFKAHPNFGDVVPRDRTYSNVVVLDPAVDLNDVLPLCDVLVTDYSSVAFDFLLLDRPIVYFLPDHERYVSRRNLYFTLEEMTAGPVVTDAPELYRVLAAEPVDDPAARAELRQRVWGDYAGGASAAIADVLAVTPR